MSSDSVVTLTPFAVALGIEFLPPAGGTACARLQPTPAHESCVGSGAVHVSVLTAMLDNTCGAAVRLARTGADTPFATLVLRLDHFAPAHLEQLVWAEAECYRLTADIAYARAWLWQEDRDKPLAGCTATFMLHTRAGPGGDGAVTADPDRATRI